MPELLATLKAILELGAPAVYLLALWMLWKAYQNLQAQCLMDKAEIRAELALVKDKLDNTETRIASLGVKF